LRDAVRGEDLSNTGEQQGFSGPDYTDGCPALVLELRQPFARLRCRVPEVCDSPLRMLV
jgi:hypothetical protein